MWESRAKHRAAVFTMLPADAIPGWNRPRVTRPRSVIHRSSITRAGSFYLVAAISDDYAREILRLVQRVILIGIPMGSRRRWSAPT